MKAFTALALVAGMSVLPIAAQAGSSGPSVLATITPLVRGTLPQVVTVYGRVGSASSARQTMMAPLQAAVTDVYVRQGALLPKGAPLVRLTPSPASRLAYARAKSELRVSVDLVHRTRSMVKSHLATDQQLFQAEKSEEDARAALAALKAQGAEGPAVVRAPFPAIVTRISTTPGAIVSEGAALIELAKPGGLVLRAGVVPNEASKIQTGDPVSLTPIGGGAAIHGKVVFRGDVVEAANGLTPIDVSVPSGQAMLGEMFRADITVGKVQGFVVPHAAVLVNNAGHTYIVQALNLTAHKVVVRVLESDGNKDLVAGSLRPDAAVVLAGNYQLDEGMKIRLANPKGTAGQ